MHAASVKILTYNSVALSVQSRSRHTSANTTAVCGTKTGQEKRDMNEKGSCVSGSTKTHLPCGDVCFELSNHRPVFAPDT